jgi:putative ATP-dependent endonuclease of OLD family
MRIISLSVSNYRTIEDLNIDFTENYNAICGKNNSGKSNLVRAIRLLFGERRGRFMFEEDIDFSYKSDICAWKKASDSKEKIKISGKVRIFRSTDEGIVAHIESLDSKLTKLKKGKDSFDLIVSIEASGEGSKLQATTVNIDGEEITESIIAQGIYEKLQNSVVFHNSTMSVRYFFSRRRSLHGIFSKIPERNKNKVGEKAQALKKEINKVFVEHANELQQMLGRLGDKLEVKLDTPEFDFEEYPYGISLGSKDFNIPLDDWGSGTRNQTLIIKSIFEAKASSHAETITDRITPIVLIEEPESFLHPLAQAQFSEALQSLSEEWGIQIIATTHSPYLLSHRSPRANTLLERKKVGKNIRGSSIVPLEDNDWKKPFEHTLGICGPEFDIFKDAFFSKHNKLLMVEGESDKEYFEICKGSEHNKNALLEGCEVFSYDGRDKICSDVLIKFIRDRFSKVVITADLDADTILSKKLANLGFEKNQNFFLLGIDQAGKRDIEGLIPDTIRQTVNNENTTLIDALRSDNNDEVKKAKSKLKKKYLEKFKSEAKIQNGDFSEFYKIIGKINKTFK